MNWRVLRAFIVKELKQTLRDPRMRSLLFVAPVIQMTLFGLALRNEVRNIRLAVVAAPDDRLANAIASRAEGSGWFHTVTTTHRDPYAILEAGEADAVLVAPPGGMDRAAQRGSGDAQLLVDGTNTVRAQGVAQYFEQVRQAVQKEKLGFDPLNQGPRLKVQSRILYNPTLESRTFMVPGVLAMLLVLVTLTLTASSITREKERGTFETLLAAPIGRAEILLGKSTESSASLLRLVFAGAESDQPLLSDVIRRFNVDVNVLHGQIDEVQGQPFGTLAVLARGAAAPLAAAIAHLRAAGVLVQEVSHA